MTLFEIHRPKSLSDVVGQSKTVKALQSLLSRNAAAGAFYFSGPSGQGKTSVSRALLADLKVDSRDITNIGGADCTADFVRELRYNFSLATWGDSGFKAVIVDEAHAMSKQAVQVWLPFLEELPAKRIVLFTSTEAIQSDMFGNFTAPLASRCKVFEMSIDQNEAAAHLANVASGAGLNGQPLSAYRALLVQCHNNVRMALQKIETGEMLASVQALPCTVAESKPLEAMSVPERLVAVIPDSTLGKVAARVLAPSNRSFEAIQKDIEAEKIFGAKFLAGSKNPKYFAHCERLTALQTELKGVAR